MLCVKGANRVVYLLREWMHSQFNIFWKFLVLLQLKERAVSTFMHVAWEKYLWWLEFMHELLQLQSSLHMFF